MKFIVSSTALLKQLSNINGVVTTNPVVPILENFLFEIEKGVLTITASDLQTSMITEVEVEAKESGSIAVPARILIDTLKNLPEQPVTLSIDEEDFTCGKPNQAMINIFGFYIQIHDNKTQNNYYITSFKCPKQMQITYSVADTISDFERELYRKRFK